MAHFTKYFNFSVCRCNVFHHSSGHPSPWATLKMYVKSAFPTPSNFNNHLIARDLRISKSMPMRYGHSLYTVPVLSLCMDEHLALYRGLGLGWPEEWWNRLGILCRETFYDQFYADRRARGCTTALGQLALIKAQSTVSTS